MGAGQRTVEQWTDRYLTADEHERRLVAAAVVCIARWGLAKTSLDDIARAADVSRATVYRAFPGGKERLVDTVIQHELGRLFHEAAEALAATTTLEDLLCEGVSMALRELTEHEALSYLVSYEPEAILPFFAFNRLDPLLAYAAELSRPYLRHFLPDDEVRPAAELIARLVLSFAFSPSAAVDHRDPTSIRRLVTTYLLPALSQEHPA